MAGLTAYGAYIPYHRLERRTIGAALGTAAGSGARTVASYDEDTTSMGVEAARVALRSAPTDAVPGQLFFATTVPAYLDKTNATAVYAALHLDRSGLAVDMVGSVRSGLGAIVAASESTTPTLAVLSDIRVGQPGGSDERDGGDAAAALLFGGASDAPVIAEVLAQASATQEFLDRWRAPGAASSKVWEERFGEQAYLPLAHEAFAAALKRAALIPDDVDHLIVAGLHARAVRSFVRSSGVRPEALTDDLTKSIGNSGAAQPGVLLADVLDRAEPDRVVALVVLADGASVILLRTTPALTERREQVSVAEQIASGNTGLAYATYLAWRGLIEREPPRRPDPTPPAAPPSFRREKWKFAFVASECDECGTRFLPPVRVCQHCHAVDRMSSRPLADVPATVATFTVDRLAFTPSPPLVAAVIDFDGGGRLRCEMTDVDPDAVAIEDRVEMTFRRVSTAKDVHNYFWKARPARTSGEQD